jgi:hypothetical protein
MSPVGSCRLVRLVPFRAVLLGLRAAEIRPVPPKPAWFVCKWFAPRLAKKKGWMFDRSRSNPTRLLPARRPRTSRPRLWFGRLLQELKGLAVFELQAD